MYQHRNNTSSREEQTKNQKKNNKKNFSQSHKLEIYCVIIFSVCCC